MESIFESLLLTAKISNLNIKISPEMFKIDHHTFCVGNLARYSFIGYLDSRQNYFFLRLKEPSFLGDIFLKTNKCIQCGRTQNFWYQTSNFSLGSKLIAHIDRAQFRMLISEIYIFFPIS